MHSYTSKKLKAWRTPTAPSATNQATKRMSTRVAWNDSSRAPLLKKKSWAIQDESPMPRQTRRCCFMGLGFESGDLLQIGLVALVNTVLSSQLPLLNGKPQPDLLSLLFSQGLYNNTTVATWTLHGTPPLFTMFLCLLMKWSMTVLSLSMPTPTGVVAPTMVIGALIGRVYALLIPEQLVVTILSTPTNGGVVTEAMRGGFAARLAIVGAASFSSGVTRAFAMAITVFEVLALPDAILPLSCASLAAIAVANNVNVGFFDQILINKGMANVSAMSTRKSMWPVSRVMRRLDVHSECLSNLSSLSDVDRLLDNFRDSKCFPIVHHLPGSVDALLMGSVTRDGLEEIVRSRPSKYQWEKNLVIDFLDPMHWKKGCKQHVNRAPLHVSPETAVKDVYLLLKVMWNEDYVFVTHNGRLLGLIDAEQMIGKK